MISPSALPYVPGGVPGTETLITGGPVAIVILGGSHDLGPEIEAQNPRCKYEVIPYKRLAEK